MVEGFFTLLAEQNDARPGFVPRNTDFSEYRLSIPFELKSTTPRPQPTTAHNDNLRRHHIAPKLLAVQLGVEPALGQQLVVGSRLNDAARLEHHNPVGCPNRR